MNDNIVIDRLIKISRVLDENNFYREAESLTQILIKIAQAETPVALGPDGNQIDIDGQEQVKNPPQPEPSSRKITIDGEQIEIPSHLNMEETFDGKKYFLSYNKDKKELF